MSYGNTNLIEGILKASETLFAEKKQQNIHKRKDSFDRLEHYIERWINEEFSPLPKPC